MKHVATLLLLLTAVVLFAGCASVQPYQREFLADPIMAFEDDDHTTFETEIVEIREAGSGGKGGSGGGCGCN